MILFFLLLGVNIWIDGKGLLCKFYITKKLLLGAEYSFYLVGLT